MIFTYRRPDLFETIEKPIFHAKDRIYLWGAGKVGSVVAHSMKKKNIEFVAFVDSAKDKQGKLFCGHKIISPEEMYAQGKDIVVVVSSAFPQVLEELRAHGIKKAYDPHSLLMVVDFDGYEGGLTYEFACRITENALRNHALYLGTYKTIERLLFLITDKCTLKCRNCDAYMPFYKNPSVDSYETIVESFERITEVFGYIEHIDLLGGEPLIHQDIAKITKFFAEDKRCGTVTIISNGTVLPKDDLLEILKKYNCTLRISDYGIWSRNKEKIIEKCKKEKINIEITNYSYWDRAPLIQKMEETEEQLNLKFSTCTTNLFYVEYGKLFYCMFVVGLYGLEQGLIPNMQKNYVDLLGDDKEKIQKFADEYLYSKKHIDACKYCPGSHCIHFEDKQPVAEQAEGILPIENLFKDGKRLCISPI